MVGYVARRCVSAALPGKPPSPLRAPGARSFAARALPESRPPTRRYTFERLDATSAAAAGRNPRSKPWEGPSLATPKLEVSEDCEDFIKGELERFKPMGPRPVSIAEVLEMIDPVRIAKFVHSEVPVRYAERIDWIEAIPGWDTIPDLVDVRERMFFAFREMRLVQRTADLQPFTDIVRKILKLEKDLHETLARGLFQLTQARQGQEFGPEVADPWLDRFLLNRIGSHMLLLQYRACYKQWKKKEGGDQSESEMLGVIDPACDVGKICREVADEVMEWCKKETGKDVFIKVCVHAPWEEKRGEISDFSYIPAYLKFLMSELLKNSTKATAQLELKPWELKKKRVDVIIAADSHNVAIRVADRGQGVPFEIGDRIFSYFYSTKEAENPDGSNGATGTGYGVGLPHAKLYARYLGGDLSFTSLPGYGTSVDLRLPRISKEIVESVPDNNSFSWRG